MISFMIDDVTTKFGPTSLRSTLKLPKCKAYEAEATTEKIVAMLDDIGYDWPKNEAREPIKIITNDLDSIIIGRDRCGGGGGGGGSEESQKKIELQESLLEVLESERVVITNENSRLASESLFMKRKARELSRRVFLERSEDQGVFVLSRKIDDLQGHIYELEKKAPEKQQHESSEEGS
ncbi:hypothetical protein L6452_37416 [Arctium lappa]|uniref:Uncharacterized protein n=1 Tax=Arctium lappa TaxID=4217 RepID=A0ACB8Y3Z5_ARCLA|nr:hypothetical protein L6452_37416 [Arctium lappa]